MIDLRASWTSPVVFELMEGPLRRGVGLGHGYIDFGGYVVAVTRPGSGRMPNGLECTVDVRAGDEVLAGDGRLSLRGFSVQPGAPWNPRPSPRVELRIQPRLVPDAARLAGRGPGLTPAGDDVLVGYAAGLGLFNEAWEEAMAIVRTAAPLTTALSATLLGHAARGELPESAHALLERGNPSPLLNFGQSSGRYMLWGLGLACVSMGEASERRRPQDQGLGRRQAVMLPGPDDIRWAIVQRPSSTGKEAGRPSPGSRGDRTGFVVAAAPDMPETHDSPPEGAGAEAETAAASPAA